MSQFSVNNKLGGDAHFEISPIHGFDQWPEMGVSPLLASLDGSGMKEVVLCLFDKTPAIYSLAATRPFDLFLKVGSTETANGPVMFLLFSVPDPTDPTSPLAAVECHINPFDTGMMNILRKLAGQSHWHLLLIGNNQEVVDLFEFENGYDLEQALDAVAEGTSGMTPGDFNLALEEFNESHSLDDLNNA